MNGPVKKNRTGVACAKCRRSKVKCVNQGVGTTCDNCRTSNRECEYAIPIPGAVARRTDISAVVKPEDGEPVRKSRVRKSDVEALKPSLSGPKPRSTEDPLDPSLLTMEVWTELLDIFKLQYSTELSFLHQPTFSARVRTNMSQNQSKDTPASTEFTTSKAWLLAFLTLTARFHPELRNHFAEQDSEKKNDQLAASEFYATAQEPNLGTLSFNTTSIELVQTHLMLSVHYWGMCRGETAWTHLQQAISKAQLLGLQREDEDDGKDAKITPQPAGGEGLPSNQDVEENITKEIRRRTLFSCFILDRYLSGGRDRALRIDVENLRVRLPGSDDAFVFGEKSETGFLQVKETGKILDGMRLVRQVSMRDDESVLSRYIRLVEIWGRFSKWSCLGGRRLEQNTPPWDERTNFYEFRQQLQTFHASLPRNLTFSESNLSAHLSRGTASTYTALHALSSLCKIMLHREYIPFAPLRFKRPQGPLDEPTFPPDRFPPPPGFWEESAEEMFRAASDILRLARMYQEWVEGREGGNGRGLVETPQVGFAIYTAAFVGVYAFYFEDMDTANYMTGNTPDARHREGPFKGATALAVKMLRQMRPRLPMAYGWGHTIRKMWYYYHDMVEEYNDNINKLVAEGMDPHDSIPDRRLREGGPGGGLDEYLSLEAELKDFGELKDRDVIRDDSVNPTSPSSTNEPGTNPDPMQGLEGGWQAVNNNTNNSASNTLSNLARVAGDELRQANSSGHYSPRTGAHGSSASTSIASPYHQQDGLNDGSIAHSSHSPMPGANAPHALSSAKPGTGSGQRDSTWINKQERTYFGGADVLAFADGTLVGDMDHAMGDAWLEGSQTRGTHNFVDVINNRRDTGV